MMESSSIRPAIASNIIPVGVCVASQPIHYLIRIIHVSEKQFWQSVRTLIRGEGKNSNKNVEKLKVVEKKVREIMSLPCRHTAVSCSDVAHESDYNAAIEAIYHHSNIS
jgi:hypothetical protein